MKLSEVTKELLVLRLTAGYAITEDDVRNAIAKWENGEPPSSSVEQAVAGTCNFLREEIERDESNNSNATVDGTSTRG